MCKLNCHGRWISPVLGLYKLKSTLLHQKMKVLVTHATKPLRQIFKLTFGWNILPPICYDFWCDFRAWCLWHQPGFFKWLQDEKEPLFKCILLDIPLCLLKVSTKTNCQICPSNDTYLSTHFAILWTFWKSEEHSRMVK